MWSSSQFDLNNIVTNTIGNPASSPAQQVSEAQDSIPDPLQVSGRKDRVQVHCSLIRPQVLPTVDDDARDLVTSLEAAREGALQMNNMPSSMGKAFVAVNTCQSAVDQLDTVNSWLQPIKVFISVVQTISNVRPLSFGVLVTKLCLDSPICKTSFMCTIMGRSGISQSYTRLHIYLIGRQTIIAQSTMDESVVALLSKISHVYTFLIEDHTITNVAQIKEPLSEISKLMPNCVVFIQSYSKTKSFCMSYSYLSFNVRLISLYEGQRTMKNVLSETNTAITTYGNALDVLTQQCRDLICRDTWVAVHGLAAKADHISADVGNIRDVVEHVHYGVKDIREDVRCALEGVHHVQGAICHALNSIETIGKDGFHTTVTCPK